MSSHIGTKTIIEENNGMLLSENWHVLFIFVVCSVENINVRLTVTKVIANIWLQFVYIPRTTFTQSIWSYIDFSHSKLYTCQCKSNHFCSLTSSLSWGSIWCHTNLYSKYPKMAAVMQTIDAATDVTMIIHVATVKTQPGHFVFCRDCVRVVNTVRWDDTMSTVRLTVLLVYRDWNATFTLIRTFVSAFNTNMPHCKRVNTQCPKNTITLSAIVISSCSGKFKR